MSRLARLSVGALLLVAACPRATPYQPDAATVDPCEGVSCSGHGRCEAWRGDPVCFCDPGYVTMGLECVPESPPPLPDGGIEPEYCGDGICGAWEDAASCAVDCPARCGDGLCTGWEDVWSCPADCPAVCGDGLCSHREDEWSCPEDCGEGDCDPVSGVGCRDDEACKFYSRDGVRWEYGCVPLYPEDAAGPGEPCAGLADPYFGSYDNCVGGYFCVRRVATSEYACEKWCASHRRDECSGAYPDETGALTVDGLCISDVSSWDFPIDGLMLCQPAGGCSATCQDCADDAGDPVGCYAMSDGLNHGTLCSPFAREGFPGDGVTGDRCDFINNCRPGYTCLGGECRPFCDPTETYPGDGTECPFVFCEDRVGEAAGRCEIPHGSEDIYGPEVGLGLCCERRGCR